jgi:hypothetical protein
MLCVCFLVAFILTLRPSYNKSLHSLCASGLGTGHRWNFVSFVFSNGSYYIGSTCYRAHAQAAANMQQQPPGGLPPGMMHPASHSPLQLQPPGPSQPHVPGLFVAYNLSVLSTKFYCSCKNWHWNFRHSKTFLSLNEESAVSESDTNM